MYIFVLFLIAYFGDSDYQNASLNHNNNVVYALSLAVYCSSWTFYGAVGTAATDGLDYLAIYLGPCLIFLFGYPMMRRIILICKQNSITSISDFISSRYGKDRHIGVLVTCIAVVGSLPYIALQLKAVSSSYLVLISSRTELPAGGFISDNIALLTGIALALFTILFGTRHLDATEHHKGMILAVAFESIVKLVAILAVGYYAMYLLMDNSAHSNFSQFLGSAPFSGAFAENNSTWASFLTKTLLSTSAIFLLPRQFQVAIVEARDHHQFKTAMWVMPVYLVLTSVIVIPIALSGMVLLPDSQADLYVLTLPLTAGNDTLALIAFIGGLSAATGMVIVAAISLSTMVCNDLVMPYLISVKRLNILNHNNLNNIILIVRRVAIVALIAGAYGYYVLIDSNALLANIGLVSFAAIIQFLPAVLCALYWRNANRKGVFWGLLCGFVIWGYTLMLPTILSAESVDAIFGKGAWLHPQALFGLSFDNPLTHGVFWSLSVNIGLLVWYSKREAQSVLEKIQASRFSNTVSQVTDLTDDGAKQPYIVHPDALRILAERIIGVHNTSVLFSQFEQRNKVSLTQSNQVDRRLISLVQTAIAGVIGTTSAQKVIADSLLGDEEYLEEVTSFVDETSSVLKFNRNLLQTTLQNITHGISVVDSDSNLVIWNDQYLKLFDYPDGLIYVGKPLREVLEHNAERGDFGDKNKALEISKRLKYLERRSPYSTVRQRANGTTIKAIGEPMPGGGFVTTYEDITEGIRASELLRKANEELEDRVRERTRELEALTQELERNTRSKTHFLAAASHDLLQPINAARLFTHSISERSADQNAVRELAVNVDQSLVTANELLRALLDISKLDSGGIQPESSNMDLVKFVESLVGELQPSAHDKQVSLQQQIDPITVRSDKQLLHSVMQNLVSNALRYTASGGKVVVNTELLDDAQVKLSVQDSGAGIAEQHLDQIFNEFYQIKTGSKSNARGLGLGLSIVKRISKLLDLQVAVESVENKGSTFSIRLPVLEARETVPEKVAKSSNVAFSRLSGASILCLDNDESVLEAMRTLLQSWGCVVTSVATYKQGVNVLNESQFDVVLADYRLDYDETGLELLSVASVIHGEKNTSNINGVLITAEQDKSLNKQASDLGFHYLAKPIEPASLKSLLLFLLTHDAHVS